MGCFKGNTLLMKIAQWHEENEHQKIIDTIEGLPEAEQTPELISLLARAYNNLAEAENRSMFHKAIDLLSGVEGELKEDHLWNFRMAYAYYYLDQDNKALSYFEKALEARPGDQDTLQFIDLCRRTLSLPLDIKPFRERAEACWQAFLEGEEELRRLIDAKDQSDAVVEKCNELLASGFTDICFELGFNGEKYDLILSPEGDRAKLFQLMYFKRRAPEAVLEHWNILVGRQPGAALEEFEFRMYGQEIGVKDVRVWAEGEEDRDELILSLYCEKLLPLLKEDEGRVWSLLTVLLDLTIGEITAMGCVDELHILHAPVKGKKGMSLLDLPAYLQKHYTPEGEDLNDPERYCGRYFGYELKPDDSEDAPVRGDVYVGITACAPVINAYLNGDEDLMDAFHADGVVPGFFAYPTEGFTGEERAKEVLDFRDAIEAAIREKAGEDAVTFIGGASGVWCGYLDFIAWDLRAVLNAAQEVFAAAQVPWAGAHTFRPGVRGILLKSQEDEEE